VSRPRSRRRAARPPRSRRRWRWSRASSASPARSP